LLAWLIGLLAGIVIIVLPDDNQALIELSDTHGPSAQDLIGVILIALSSIAQWTVLLRHRKRIYHRLSTAQRVVALVLALVSGGLIAWSIATDSGNWWMLGAGTLSFLLITGLLLIRDHT
jgi:hypothetical protein